MVLLKDFNKDAASLLRSKYPTDKIWEINLASKSKNPSCNFAAYPRNNGIEGNSSLKWKMGKTHMETKINTNGTASWETRLTPADGMDITAKYEKPQNYNNSSIVELEAELTGKYGHSKFRLSPLYNYYNQSLKDKDNEMISLCNTLSTKYFLPYQLHFGMDMSGNLKSYNSLKCSFGAALMGPFHTGLSSNSSDESTITTSLQTISNSSSNLSGIVAGIYLNSLSNKSELGAMITYNFQNGASSNTTNENNSSNLSLLTPRVQLLFGGKWTFGHNNNDDSKFFSGTTDVKFRISNDAKVAYSLTHRFHKNLSATFGAQFDTYRMSSPDSVKYGIIFDLTA
ncbi:hypothetical protein ACR3K2_14110 [Cryptosporidium serpentis]